MDIEVEDYALIQRLADMDVEVLREKGRTYGRSWMKRGGVGAFMMLARKWDRLENAVYDVDYNVFGALDLDPEDNGPLESIRDLRRYLLLVEAEWLGRQHASAQPRYSVASVPTPGAPPISAPRAG